MLVITPEGKKSIEEALKGFHDSEALLYKFYVNESDCGLELSSRSDTVVTDLEEYAKEKGLKLWGADDDLNAEEFSKKRISREKFIKDEYKNICNTYGLNYTDEKYLHVLARIEKATARDNYFYIKLFRDIVNEAFLDRDTINQVLNANENRLTIKSREAARISELKNITYEFICKAEKLLINPELF